ncbi:MAG: paraquat-inducible protein A [Proteobacteria bacterium]|nr:paraquat-inducible protein A [Pseudomonadota bacterium]
MSAPGWVICQYCDALYRARALAPAQLARCASCRAVLGRGGRLDAGRLLALTVAAGIVFVIANASPVITLSAHGQFNHATLLQAVAAMLRGSDAAIGVMVGVTLFVVPLLQIALLAWVLAFARLRRRAPAFVPAMRVLQLIHPWSMTEVLLLGVLVAIVKLSASLSVITGAGTYAIVALTLLITLIAKRDTAALWELGGR